MRLGGNLGTAKARGGIPTGVLPRRTRWNCPHTSASPRRDGHGKLLQYGVERKVFNAFYQEKNTIPIAKQCYFLKMTSSPIWVTRRWTVSRSFFWAPYFIRKLWNILF
jgi:hypothetical protein